MQDRRREPRFPTNVEVEVLLLSESDARVKARLSEVSGCGARMAVPRPIAPGTPVRIELNDSLLLGEISYCSAANGGFACGVQLEQVLSNLSDVARLMRHLNGEEMLSRVRRE